MNSLLVVINGTPPPSRQQSEPVATRALPEEAQAYEPKVTRVEYARRVAKALGHVSHNISTHITPPIILINGIHGANHLNQAAKNFTQVLQRMYGQEELYDHHGKALSQVEVPVSNQLFNWILGVSIAAKLYHDTCVDKAPRRDRSPQLLMKLGVSVLGTVTSIMSLTVMISDGDILKGDLQKIGGTIQKSGVYDEEGHKLSRDASERRNLTNATNPDPVSITPTAVVMGIAAVPVICTVVELALETLETKIQNMMSDINNVGRLHGASQFLLRALGYEVDLLEAEIERV